MAVQTADLTFTRLEERHYGRLLTQIQKIIAETGSHLVGTFDEAMWRWHYEALPTGETHVYAALRGEEVLAYYHVPVHRGRVRGQAKAFGMVQGVAVSRTLRGQGIFRKLATYAHEQLDRSDVDLIYTFPNVRSIHTFLKYNGYTNLGALPAYVLPVRTARLVQSKLSLWGLERVLGAGVDRALNALGQPLQSGESARLLPSVTQEVATVFEAYEKPFGVTLRRDLRYLRWRFDERPAGRHLVFAIERRGEAQAAAVLKLDEMLGVSALVLMDFACRPGQERSLNRLLSHVRRHARRYANEEVALLFAAGSDPLLRRLPRIGFLPVPERFNPRPLHLLVRNVSLDRAAPLFDKASWRVALSDWDVL